MTASTRAEALDARAIIRPAADRIEILMGFSFRVMVEDPLQDSPGVMEYGMDRADASLRRLTRTSQVFRRFLP